jgi:hypothetical protein
MVLGPFGTWGVVIGVRADGAVCAAFLVSLLGDCLSR